MRSKYLPQKKRQQGFSLLEALIASTIFAAVLLIASSAFKFFMSMGARPVNSERVMIETMNSIKVRGSIKGLHHYYLRENAISIKEAKPFFSGKENGFTGITLNAIDFEQQPTRITVTAKKDENSITNLVYCEYDNKQLFPTKTISSDCDYPKILVADIKAFKIAYFGWVSLNALFDTSAISGVSLTKSKEWAREWDAEKRGLLPQYIRFSIEYDESDVSYKPTQLWFYITDADPVQFSVVSSRNE